MKVYTLLFSLLFSIQLPALDTPEQLFEKANTAYNEKNYKGAITIYEQILDLGYQSIETYYNLGNSYYKNHQLGKAILNYERVLLLDSKHKDASFNLTVLNDEIKADLNEIPPFFLSRWIHNLQQYFSAGTWSILGLGVLWLGIGGFCLWQIGRNRSIRKKGFLFGSLLLTISLILLFLAKSRIDYERNSGKAILIVAEEQLRSAPDAESKAVFLIFEGTKLDILDQIGNWQKVRLINGEQGWLPQKSLETI